MEIIKPGQLGHQDELQHLPGLSRSLDLNIITVGSFGEKSQKPAPSSNISKATGRCFDRRHSSRDYSKVV